MKVLRRALVTTALASGMTVGGIAIATGASAQPLVTGGLVNVTVTNLLNGNQVGVQIPVNAAANICGVDVSVLSNVATTPFTCTSRSGSQSLTISAP